MTSTNFNRSQAFANAIAAGQGENGQPSNGAKPCSRAKSCVFLRFFTRDHRAQSSTAPDQSGSVTSIAKISRSTAKTHSPVQVGGTARQSVYATNAEPRPTRHATKRRRRSLTAIAYSSLLISLASHSLSGFAAELSFVFSLVSMAAILVGLVAALAARKAS